MNLRMIVKCLFVFGLLASVHSLGGSSVSSESMVEQKSSAVTWYVDADGGADFTRIQDALNASSDGDTVFVYGGIYTELINIGTSVSLIGEDKYTTAVNGARKGTPIRVWSSNVTVQGFNVLNGVRDGFSAGINVYGRHVQVSDCIVQANNCGFRLTYTDDVLIDDCIIRANSAHSVYLIASSNVTIQGCDIYWNGYAEGSISGGIAIDAIENEPVKSNIRIRHCNIYENAFDGIGVGDGFTQEGFTDIVIEQNNIYNNTRWGIRILKNEAVIRDNHIIGNGQSDVYDAGIYLSGCNGLVTIDHNVIASNRNYGVYLMRSHGNTIQRNNFIDNQRSARLRYENNVSNHWSGNYWDTQLLPGVKMLLGTYYEFFPIVNFDWHPAQEPYEIL